MRRKLYWIAPLLLILGACTPHSSAGGWRSTTANAPFERLEMRFNGSGEFYTRAEDETAAWRCFWGAEEKFVAGLTCIDANDENNEKKYELLIDEDKQGAVLKLDGQELGRYKWQMPLEL